MHSIQNITIYGLVDMRIASRQLTFSLLDWNISFSCLYIDLIDDKPNTLTNSITNGNNDIIAIITFYTFLIMELNEIYVEHMPSLLSTPSFLPSFIRCLCIYIYSILPFLSSRFCKQILCDFYHIQ